MALCKHSQFEPMDISIQVLFWGIRNPVSTWGAWGAFQAIQEAENSPFSGSLGSSPSSDALGLSILRMLDCSVLLDNKRLLYLLSTLLGYMPKCYCLHLHQVQCRIARVLLEPIKLTRHYQWNSGGGGLGMNAHDKHQQVGHLPVTVCAFCIYNLNPGQTQNE